MLSVILQVTKAFSLHSDRNRCNFPRQLAQKYETNVVGITIEREVFEEENFHGSVGKEYFR